MSRAIVADTCTVSSMGMCCLINEALGITDAEAIAQEKQVVQAVEQHHPYLLVLNLTTMGVRCLDVVECTKSLSPKTKVLVFDADFTGVFLSRFWALGIDGYCTNKAEKSELIHALKNVRQGKKYVCKTVSAYLLEHSFQPRGMQLHERFSWRELQIFLMTGTGKSSGEIAELLCISKQAVSTYKHRIFQKSNMKSSIEIAHYISKHELCRTDALEP